MRVKRIVCLLILCFLTACAQKPSINLPPGISKLDEIDPAGLRSPIWSPDGTKIAVSYVIEPVYDIFSFAPPEPRHDVAIVDTKTWKTSLIFRDEPARIEAWSYDSKILALSLFTGPEGSGIYTTEVNNIAPIYLSQTGLLSPDFRKVAFFEDSFIKIMNIRSGEVNKYKVPLDVYWRIDDWSPDIKKLALVYNANNHSNIYFLDLKTGDFSKFTSDTEDDISSPQFSPSGKLIAYIAWRYTESGIETMLLFSRLDNKCERIIPIKNIIEFAWSPDGQRMFLRGIDGVYVADLNLLFGSGFADDIRCP